MPDVVDHPHSAHAATRAPKPWADVIILALVAGVFGTILFQASESVRDFRPMVSVSLEPSALPLYALRSLGRGLASYLVSLAVTLVFATWAARSARAERILIPLFDILQGIPVLGFLPGLVLGMVALFPGSNLGLELACILMIFTGQAWNMIFAYYGALKTVPPELRDIARVHRFTPGQDFSKVELSSGAIPLVWNSMISMAGGWFFLTVNEAFTLEGRDFRLPGIGSYMSVAIDRGDTGAMVWAVIAMTAVILATDQLLWRPLIAWAARFSPDDADEGAAQSWVLDLWDRSFLAKWIHRRRMRRHEDLRNLVKARVPTGGREREARWEPEVEPLLPKILAALRVLLVGGLVGLTAWGLHGAWKLLGRVGPNEWGDVFLSILWTFLRIAAAVVLSCAWTIPVGIWIGRRAKLRKILSPVVQVVAAFPAPMLFPLLAVFIVNIGIPFDVGCVILMVAGAQWYLLFNIIAGASTRPAELDDVARIMGLTGWRRWWILEIPSIFPSLLTGLITAAGGAWNACIVTEFVRFQGRTLSAPGLGTLLNRATVEGNFPLLAAGILVMAVTLVLLNRFFWKRLYHVAETRYALSAS